VRKKEDPWNSILSGATAGGILSMRGGFRAVVRSSVQCAVLVALVSGQGSRTTSHRYKLLVLPLLLIDEVWTICFVYSI
jgi:mitochondrial import inner membrane translocase subunit TIM17